MPLQYLVAGHYPCRDGFAAMVCAYRYFLNRYGGKISEHVYFLSVDVRKQNLMIETLQILLETNRIDENTSIKFFDVSLTSDSINWINKRFSKFYIVDHHVTSWENVLKSDLPTQYLYEMTYVDRDGTRVRSDPPVYQSPNCYLSTKYSGAVLAWEHYFPGASYPTFLLYIHDRDTFNKIDPQENTLEMSEAIEMELKIGSIKDDQSNLYIFDPWLLYLYEDEMDQVRERWLTIGQTVLKYKKQLVTRAAKWFQTKHIDILESTGIRRYTVAVLEAVMLVSDIGHEIYSNHPEIDFVLMWNYNPTHNFYTVSLRCNNENNNVNVSSVAKVLGLQHGGVPGGGHPAAAGFQITTEKHPINIVFAPEEPEE